MLKSITGWLLTLLAGVMLVFIAPVQAADFVVSDAAGLVQAINDANSNSEVDTITLTADITLDTVDNTSTTNGNNGLPVVNSDIVIQGAGFTIQRSSTEDFRIFHVGSGGNLTLLNLTVRNGVTVGDSQNRTGGGIYNANGTVTISNSKIIDNMSSSSGKNKGVGISNDGGTLTIRNSTLSDNTGSNTSTVWGGGIFNNSGHITLSNSTLSGNTSDLGAGIYNAGGSLVVENSAFFNNSGSSLGGSIYSYGNAATVTLDNSTLSNNRAFYTGAGIYNDDGTLTVSNSTILGNSTTEAGGGIYSAGSTSNMTLRNSIVANNSETNCAGDNFSGNNNLDDDMSCPASSLTVPGTDYDTTLADNGGPTQTHALLAGSSAIDASGTDATVAGQRGVSAQGTSRDIGAFEYGASPTYPTIVGADVTYDEADGVVDVDVNLSGASNVAGDVTFSLIDMFTGTATSSDDYDVLPPIDLTVDCSIETCSSGVVASFPLTIKQDAAIESDETVVFEIASTNGFGTAGSPNSFTVTIQNGAGVDVNDDGIISPADVIYVINRLNTGALSADVDGDTDVDPDDVNPVLQALGN